MARVGETSNLDVGGDLCKVARRWSIPEERDVKQGRGLTSQGGNGCPSHHEVQIEAVAELVKLQVLEQPREGC